MTLKRLETCGLGWRVHVGEQPLPIAGPIDVFSGHDTRRHRAGELAHPAILT